MRSRTSAPTRSRTAASRWAIAMYGTGRRRLRARSHAKRAPCLTRGRRGTVTSSIPAAAIAARVASGVGASSGATKTISWSGASRRRSSYVRIRLPESVGHGTASSTTTTLTRPGSRPWRCSSGPCRWARPGGAGRARGGSASSPKKRRSRCPRICSSSPSLYWGPATQFTSRCERSSWTSCASRIAEPDAVGAQVGQHARDPPSGGQEEHVVDAALEPREHGPRVAAGARVGVEDAAVADLVADQGHRAVDEVGHEQPAVVVALEVDAGRVDVQPVLGGALGGDPPALARPVEREDVRLERLPHAPALLGEDGLGRQQDDRHVEARPLLEDSSRQEVGGARVGLERVGCEELRCASRSRRASRRGGRPRAGRGCASSTGSSPRPSGGAAGRWPGPGRPAPRPRGTRCDGRGASPCGA